MSSLLASTINPGKPFALWELPKPMVVLCTQGGNRGAPQGGFLYRAIELQLISPDFYLGQSIGGINVAALGSRLDRAFLELWQGEKAAELFTTFSGNRTRMRELLTEVFRNQTIQGLAFPTEIGASRGPLRQSHWFSDGRLVDTLSASCGIPVLMGRPHPVAGERYYDGGWSIDDTFGLNKAAKVLSALGGKNGGTILVVQAAGGQEVESALRAAAQKAELNHNWHFAVVDVSGPGPPWTFAYSGDGLKAGIRLADDYANGVEQPKLTSWGGSLSWKDIGTLVTGGGSRSQTRMSPSKKPSQLVLQ